MVKNDDDIVIFSTKKQGNLDKIEKKVSYLIICLLLLFLSKRSKR